MRKAGALLATGITFSVAIVGWAGPARASDSNRLVNICNYSNQKVSVARVLDMPGGMVSSGWQNYANGECRALDARFMRIQAYADGSTYWQLATFTSQFCVTNEAFTIYSPSSPSACRTAVGYMTPFYSVPAGSETYNLNLRPAPD
jgi:uncharacterized membrane protein